MSNSNQGFRVQVTVELGHHASTRKKPTPEGFTHDWTVFVRGPDGSKIHYFIEKVVFHLHETFTKSKRVVKEPPYSVSESGYAGFIINIDIYFKNKDNPKKVSINYDLFLPAEGFDPINHTHCEKLTFQNPTEEFRSKLLKAGGVEYPIGSAPPNQPFTEVFGPPIITDSKKHQNQLTSGKEKDKGSKYKTSSDVIKSSTSHCTSSSAPSAPPIASKDIKPVKEKTSGKEAAAQKRMLKSSPEQSSGKKLKRDNSAESKDKEKHKSHKDKKHSDTSNSKTSTVKSESSKSKSRDKSEHVRMKDGSKKHRSDKDQSTDSKPSTFSKSHSDVKKKPEKLSPLRDSPKTDSVKSSDGSKRKLEKVSPLQDSPLAKDSSKNVGDVKRKPEKVSPMQDSSDDDNSSDSEPLPSSKSVSSSCSSPLSSLSEDDEDVQMVMSIIAEDSDASPLSSDVSRKQQSDSEPKDRKPPAIKSESKPSKSHHSSHTTSASVNSSSKKSSQTKSSAKPEISKTDSSKTESSSKSGSSKLGSKSDVSKLKDSKSKKEKMPTTPSKTSKPKEVRDSKPQTELKPVKCVNGDIPEKAPNGEKIVNLLEMQRTIMKLSDRKVLQQVVNLISKTGLFNITEETFDFDLCKLDIGTVNKIKNAISHP